MSETGIRADWATKDYYAELGVDKKATQAEIKKAYRKLARANHPDSNPGDTAKHEKFKAVAEAYDVIGDEEKRKKYDEVAAPLRRRRFRGGFPGGSAGERRRASTSATCCATARGGFGDLFGDIFGEPRRRQPQPHAPGPRAPTSRPARPSASPTPSTASRSASG